MSKTELLERLGAPLKNMIWSWGVDSERGEICLRVSVNGEDFCIELVAKKKMARQGWRLQEVGM